MPWRVGRAIELVSTPHLTEAKEYASLLIWDYVVYFDCGRESRSSHNSLMPLGSGMVLPGRPSATMLPMVLPTLLGLDAKLPGPWLLMPESIGRVALGSQVQLDSPEWC